MIYGYFALGEFFPAEKNIHLEANMKSLQYLPHNRITVFNSAGKVYDIKKREMEQVNEDNRDQYIEYLI